MITMLLPWLKSPNLWLVAGILAMVLVIFSAGQRYEERKTEAEVAAVNVPIAEQRGKDEAEVAAEAAAAKTSDAVVSEAIKQTCVLTAETAKLLGEVR
jgi:hypothetical protein